MIDKNLPTLIATMGLPRSGKSTWAKQQATDHGIPMVSRDAVQYMVLTDLTAPFDKSRTAEFTKFMISSLFHAGHRIVILDTTNSLRETRDFWRDARWNTVFQEFHAPARTCRKRTKCRETRRIINEMDEQWETLEDDEISAEMLGATGEYPLGRLDEDDEGAIKMAITADKQAGVVRLEFGKPVGWLGLPKDHAIQLGGMLLRRAQEL